MSLHWFTLLGLFWYSTGYAFGSSTGSLFRTPLLHISAPITPSGGVQLWVDSLCLSYINNPISRYSCCFWYAILTLLLTCQWVYSFCGQWFHLRCISCFLFWCSGQNNPSVLLLDDLSDCLSISMLLLLLLFFCFRMPFLWLPCPPKIASIQLFQMLPPLSVDIPFNGPPDLYSWISSLTSLAIPLTFYLQVFFFSRIMSSSFPSALFWFYNTIQWCQILRHYLLVVCFGNYLSFHWCWSHFWPLWCLSDWNQA